MRIPKDACICHQRITERACGCVYMSLFTYFTLSDVWNNWSHEPSQIKAVLYTTTLIDTLQCLLFCQRFKQTHCIKVKYKNQFSQTDGLKKKNKTNINILQT